MSEALRILFSVDPELPVPPVRYGGIERIVAALVGELRFRGHQIGLAAHPESSVTVDFFIPWTGPSSRSGWDTVRNAGTLARAIQTFRPDLVHSFSRIAYLIPYLPVRSLPKLVSYQRDPSLRTTRLARHLSRGSLWFSGCSEHIAATGRSGGGHWTAIPNFIDPRRFDFNDSVPPDAPLVFLSRIEPIKGCHTAIAIAKASGRRLLIAGNRVESGSSAGYWDREIAPHLGRDGIEYIGEVDDAQKNALLGQAAALVVPIEWEEPFGIVFAEALACGTPVISCPRGAIPEIVENGVHGFLVRTIGEGAEAVNKLDQISRKTCRKRAEEHFTLAAVADKYVDLYRSLL